MAIHRLNQYSEHSAGVVLPKEELLDEALVTVRDDGVIEEVAEMNLRIERFDRGAWQVVRTDQHDYPAFFERPAFQQPAKPTA